MITDSRSALTVKILNANPRAYESLVVTANTSAFAREQLAAVEPEQLLAEPAKSPAAAYAMLAGLWLWHDALDECHLIVQQSPDAIVRNPVRGKSLGTFTPRTDASKDLQQMTATYAFWHAIMHRREGDFSNSKYWFARCENHPAFPPLAAEVNQLLAGEAADKSFLRLTHNGWNPSALVDLVQAVESEPADPRRHAVIRVQQAEWRHLFQHCLRQAME